MGSIVVLTILWIIISGLMNQQHPVQLIPSGEISFFTYAFWAAVGHGSIKTVYSYLGYYNVCHLGGEIKNPEKNIPRSIFLSISGIAVIYLLMQLSVLAVIPWQEAKGSQFIVSIFFE